MNYHQHDKSGGQLFVFEGADGVGKTELSNRLLAQIRRDGFSAQFIAFPGRESSSIGGVVYQIHHDPLSLGISEVDSTALQILHIAAHADSITRIILPLLRRGIIVLLDRYWWSTWVYGLQSGVKKKTLRQMINLENDLWGLVRPSIVWVLTRKAPLRPEKIGWHLIQKQYLELARSQANKTKVQIIQNDGSIDSSLSALYKSFLKAMPKKEAVD